MTARERLSDRRTAETIAFEFAGMRYVVTLGRYCDGRLAECFLRNCKNNSAADVNARDAGILLSLCLQFGCPAETIARALSRNSDGSASGVIGAVLDLITGRP
jgi:hypothetical protein